MIQIRIRDPRLLRSLLCRGFINDITTGPKKSKLSLWSPQNWATSINKHIPKYSSMTSLEKLNFDNLALRTLPIDTESDRQSRQVPNACFSRIDPLPVKNPQIVAISTSVLGLLDLNESEAERPEFVEYFSGCKVLAGTSPAAHCYCGHQFGYFSGQLGDGAAMYLGEIVNKKGERWEIQLKGAGRTPYSRSADGRKVLRSSIREFLCSEAIHHLGIPSTRAGSCITSDTKVVRDIFYSGNPIEERCTIVLRVAESFIRFGSFEIFKDTDAETGRKGPSVGRTDILTALLEYVIKTFYSEIWEKNMDNKENAYLEFYRTIVERTAKLVAQWQCVGWCHGVLNTDNMSIVGVTIDYGPYGFMDSYDPDFICNASDDGGRYSYIKQPEMCKWNLMKLAEALQPIVSKSEMDKILDEYDQIFESFYHDQMKKKFGIMQENHQDDKDLISDFFDVMQKTGADFTNSFRVMSKIPSPTNADFDKELQDVTDYILSQCSSVDELKKAVAPRMDPRQLNMFMMLMQMNPDLLAQMGGGHRAISQELDRIEKSKELKDMTQDMKSANDREMWTVWLKKYTDRLKLEKDVINSEQAWNERVNLMNKNNPKFILRNYIAQNAIDAAEKGDFSEVRRVLKMIEDPYSEHTEYSREPVQGTDVDTGEDAGSCSFATNYAAKPPSWASDLRVT